MNDDNQEEKKQNSLPKRLSPIIPDKQDFLNEFNKFPKGEPSVAFELVKFAIFSNKTFEGHPVTWDLIKNKWNEYLDANKVEKTPDKFMVGLKTFIEKKKYNENFSPTIKSWIKNL
jgi:hypothetical protein